MMKNIHIITDTGIFTTSSTEKFTHHTVLESELFFLVLFMNC